MTETVPTKYHNHQYNIAGEEWFTQQRPGKLQEHSEQHERHPQQADQLDPEERRPDDQGQEPAGGRHHGHGGEDLKDFCSQVGEKHISSYTISSTLHPYESLTWSVGRIIKVT